MHKIKDILEKRYKGKVTDIRTRMLGSGYLGIGHRISFKVKGKQKTVIMKQLIGRHLGKDYPADRAHSFILDHQSYNRMKGHVRSIDVLGETRKGYISIGTAKDFYLLTEEASGRDFFHDLERISATGVQLEDRRKVRMLADFLVDLHKRLYEPSLYRRKIRDTVGSGESLMSVLDFFPDELYWTYFRKLDFIVRKSVSHWAFARRYEHRLCEIHGDFHSGNLWFDGDKLTVLDRSRGMYGEAADDITAFLSDIIHYSLLKYGRLKNEFREIFDIFWNTYFKKTKDQEMREVMQPYMAFRLVILANPSFRKTPAERQLISLASNIMRDRRFDPKKL